MVCGDNDDRAGSRGYVQLSKHTPTDSHTQTGVCTRAPYRGDNRI